MAQPTAYTRQADFSDFSSNYPSTPHSGSSLDAELDALKTTIDEILANMALIQRDDGDLANRSVGIDQLASDIEMGFRTVTNWTTATAYRLRDGVFNGGVLYRCIVAHTSGTFATDLAAEYWVVVLDYAASSGLVIGTDVQAYDAALDAIAALATTDGNIIVGDGSTWVAESGATARASLGLGSIATQSASAVAITGGSATLSSIIASNTTNGANQDIQIRANTDAGTTISREIVLDPDADTLAIQRAGVDLLTIDNAAAAQFYGNLGYTTNFSTTIGGQPAADFLFHAANEKLYLRSIIMTEAADTGEIALRRVNTSMASPSAMAEDEVIGVIYWQPWLGQAAWGNGGSPNYARTAQIQARLTEDATGISNGYSGGTFEIAVTPIGSDVLRGRSFWTPGGKFAHLGRGALEDGSYNSLTWTPLGALSALVGDTANESAVSLRHSDDATEGYDFDLTHTGNVLTGYRVVTSTRTAYMVVSGTADVELGGPAGAAALKANYTASTIDFWDVTGAASGGTPVIQVAGTTTNQNGRILANGTGYVEIGNDGSRRLRVTGSSGSAVQIAATDGNLELTSFGGGAGVNCLVPIYRNGTQVVNTRDTGWTAMTGTSDKATTYDTSTVTLAQLAGRVMALQAAMTTHGLIGA